MDVLEHLPLRVELLVPLMAEADCKTPGEYVLAGAIALPILELTPNDRGSMGRRPTHPGAPPGPARP